jgi:DMSO reductase family type II enzyme chaperone
MVEEMALNNEQTAAKRSMVYTSFAAAFEYPDKDWVEEIGSGAIAECFKQLFAEIDTKLLDGVDWDALSDTGSKDDDLMVEFTRLFDAGVAGPPCSLYGGLYTEARMQNMEELVRFYNFFGLSLSEAPHELPDHITTQLEFLHFLTFRQTHLAEQGENVSDCQRAERDFIARHLGRWIPRMRAKLVEQDPKPMRFFDELTRLLEAFLYNEVERLVVVVGPVSLGDGELVASSRA